MPPSPRQMFKQIEALLDALAEALEQRDGRDVGHFVRVQRWELHRKLQEIVRGNMTRRAVENLREVGGKLGDSLYRPAEHLPTSADAPKTPLTIHTDPSSDEHPMNRGLLQAHVGSL